MNVEVRPLKESDYEDILVPWWTSWGWPAPPKDFLPDDGKSGLVVSRDGRPICAGFFYTTNSKVAWVEWVISDKDFKEEPDRHDALNLLVASLTQTAAAMGFKYVYALIKNESLIDIYSKFGYMPGDSYNKEMIKVL